MTTKIEDYALIGDLQTSALVGRDGSIDWACFPRFDSGACFAALLGTPDHGRWILAPRSDAWRGERRYHPRTLVLETEWETDTGAVRVLDFMPPRGKAPDIVRIVEGVRGHVEMFSELVVRFDYGGTIPWVRRTDGRADRGGRTRRPLLPDPGRASRREHAHDRRVRRQEGRAGAVRAHLVSVEPAAAPSDRRRARAGRDDRLLGGLGREVPLHGQVEGRRPRVARGLEGAHLLADRRNRRGADDVAPREGRRGAQLGLPLLLAARRDADAARVPQRRLSSRRLGPGGCGCCAPPRAIRRRCRSCTASAGERRLVETTLDWLPGFAGSKPVRVGNAASRAVPARRLRRGARRAASGRGCTSSSDPRSRGRSSGSCSGFLEDAWHEPDEGIWEVRGPRRHFTHSKVMAWVAFDRGVQAVERFDRARRPVERWRAIRDRDPPRRVRARLRRRS